MNELEQRYFDFINNNQILTSYEEQIEKIKSSFTVDEALKISASSVKKLFDNDEELEKKNEVIFHLLTSYFTLSRYPEMFDIGFYSREDIEAMQKASSNVFINNFYISALKYFIDSSDLKSVQSCIGNAKNDGMKEEQLNAILDKFGYASLLKEQESKTDDALDALIKAAQSLKGKKFDQEAAAHLFQQLADNFKTNTTNNEKVNDKQPSDRKEDLETELSKNDETIETELPKKEKNSENEFPKKNENNVENPSDAKEDVLVVPKVFDPNSNILDNVQRLLDLQSLPPKYSQMQALIQYLIKTGAAREDLREYVENYINDKLVGKYSVDSFKYLKALAVKCACEDLNDSEKKYATIALKCFAKSMSNVQKSSKSKEEKIDFLKQKYSIFRNLAFECIRSGNDKEIVENVIRNYDLAIDVDKMLKGNTEIVEILKKREEIVKKQELEEIFSNVDDMLDKDEKITLEDGDLQSLVAEIKGKKSKTGNDSLDNGIIKKDSNNLDDDEYNPYSEKEIITKESATAEQKISFGRRLKSALNVLWNGKPLENTDGKGGK